MTMMPIEADSPNWNLIELARFIWGNEVIWGQISKIGNNGATTVAIFDDTGGVPEAVDNQTRIAVLDGAAPPPAGTAAFLCQGKAFVGGVIAHIKVYRI
jgi:hypothetical protein